MNHNTIDAVLYCKAQGVEAYQGGTCNETDISARACLHAAMATRPERVLVKPGMGFDEGMTIVANEMNRILAYIHSLYTVYLRLVAYDRNGRIVAESAMPGPLSAKDANTRLSLA